MFKMLRFVVLAALLACSVDGQLEKEVPVEVCREPDNSGPGDDLQANLKNSGIALSEETARSLVKQSTRTKRSAQSLAQLIQAGTGPIIANSPPQKPCPKYALSYGPQNLCPHALETLYTLYYSGFCYVLFPEYVDIQQTRCLCRECRTNCKESYPNYRHYCIREHQYYQAQFWAVCRSGNSWVVRFIRRTIYNGCCHCKTFYTKPICTRPIQQIRVE